MSRALGDLEPEFAKLVVRLIDQAGLSGFPIIATQTLRTVAEQDALYAQGRTTPGRIVTHAKGGESFHNYGAAVDVVFHDDVTGHIDYNGPWRDLGQIAEGLGLVWGGRWPAPKTDTDHFQASGTIDEAKQRWEDHQKGLDSNVTDSAGAGIGG